MRTEQDADRLTAVYQRHHQQVLAYCIRRVGPSDADDAAADVFAIAWRRAEEIDWDRPLPWLYGVAYRVVTNRWRSRYRQRRLVGKIAGLAPSDPAPPEEVTVRRAQDAAALAALETLRPSDREILRLAAWEELSAAEIATALGISEAAAGQRLHRAKKRFAGALASIESSRAGGRHGH